MSSKDYLALQRERALEAIERLLPAADERPALINTAIRYAVQSGGKCLRPILVLTASEAVATSDGDPEAALHAAAAIEFLHNYTLIHDDLPSMDNDLLRRGKPTVHAKFGEANAILAGDALQALAFNLLVRPTSLTPERTVRLVRILSEAAGPKGVVGGQVEDISGQYLDEERLYFIQLHKTADLFKAAMAMGAVAGGGNDEEVEVLSEFGVNLGIAFQIIDDLLDSTDGKPNKDETTCLKLWRPDKAREMAKYYTREAVVLLSRIRGSQASAALSDLAEKMLTRVV